MTKYREGYNKNVHASREDLTFELMAHHISAEAKMSSGGPAQRLKAHAVSSAIWRDYVG